MSGWNIIWGLVVCLLAGAGSWYAAPKGPNKVLFRSSALLTITCCYLMWAIVYLAQLHPLIVPRRDDLRLEP